MNMRANWSSSSIILHTGFEACSWALWELPSFSMAVTLTFRNSLEQWFSHGISFTWNLLEMQILRPHSRPDLLNQNFWYWEPRTLDLNNSPGTVTKVCPGLRGIPRWGTSRAIRDELVTPTPCDVYVCLRLRTTALIYVGAFSNWYNIVGNTSEDSTGDFHRSLGDSYEWLHSDRPIFIEHPSQVKSLDRCPLFSLFDLTAFSGR